MNKVRLVAAVLLSLPLIVFGANGLLEFFSLPAGDGLEGDQLLQALRAGGLMPVIALSHVVVGLGLLVPRARFAAALLQLPISLGILAFHATMLPAGNGMALGMLVLNLLALSDASRLRELLRSPTGSEPL
jgi:hypothetical protein